MNVEHIKKQLTSAKTWNNEEDMSVEVKRLTPLEKKKEQKSFQLMKEAFTLHQKLTAFKTHVRDECQEVYELFLKEHALKSKSKKPPKGNFTWYNFDRSIKIEVSISQPISFDDLGIQTVKSQLEDFLSQNVDSKVDFLKDLVISAFENTNGKLDSKKVMSLLRYRSKIKDVEFQKSLDLLEESIRRPKTKTYFRVSIKTPAGGYEAIDLNLSSISV